MFKHPQDQSWQARLAGVTHSSGQLCDEMAGKFTSAEYAEALTIAMVNDQGNYADAVKAFYVKDSRSKFIPKIKDIHDFELMKHIQTFMNALVLCCGDQELMVITVLCDPDAQYVIANLISNSRHGEKVLKIENVGQSPFMME